MKTKLEDLIRELVLQEFNALSTNAVVGFQAPLGTPTEPIHKGFWKKDYKKKGAKTASPALHKEEIEIDKDIPRPDPNDKELHGSSDYFLDLDDDDEDLEENVLDKMGEKPAGNTRMPYGKTYLDKNDPNLNRSKKIVKQVNKNLNKNPYNGLKNKPEMGISISRPSLKDKKV